MSKEKIKILRLIESVRYTANDIYKVADEIMEMQKAYANEDKKKLAKHIRDLTPSEKNGDIPEEWNSVKSLGFNQAVHQILQTLKQLDYE